MGNFYNVSQWEISIKLVLSVWLCTSVIPCVNTVNNFTTVRCLCDYVWSIDMYFLLAYYNQIVRLEQNDSTKKYKPLNSVIHVCSRGHISNCTGTWLVYVRSLTTKGIPEMLQTNTFLSVLKIIGSCCASNLIQSALYLKAT